jgi:hypothetical protein
MAGELVHGPQCLEDLVLLAPPLAGVERRGALVPRLGVDLGQPLGGARVRGAARGESSPPAGWRGTPGLVNRPGVAGAVLQTAW